MKAWRSLLGAALAALYAAAFVAAYVDYARNASQFLADLGVLLLALPFSYVMRFLSGGTFAMTGDETGKIVAAALFCCALAYLFGAAVEYALRAALRYAFKG